MAVGTTAKPTTRKSTAAKPRTTKATTARAKAKTAKPAAAKATPKTRAVSAPKEAPVSKPLETVIAFATPRQVSPETAAESAVTPVRNDDVTTAEGNPVTLRKKELFERVVALSGIKKKDAKRVVEATLQVLGEALSNGEELILPPFGKTKIHRQRDLPQGEMIMVKLRRSNNIDDSDEAGDDEKDALADDDD